MDKQYKFTIVMIAYNVSAYIDEAIESILTQDIGFEHVQLILVNDGSKDDTLEKIRAHADKHKENIFVIDKENGGPGSARNVAYPYVLGKYVNFMDSDDILEKDALRKVYAFFEENYEKTDVVSIPLLWFEGQEGEHHLNYKYKKGSRVIDLKTEWDAPQLQAASCYIKKDIALSVRFDERIRYADDCKYIQQVLLRKQTLGVVADSVYHYRKRSGDNVSIIQSALWNKNWYVPCMKYSYLELMEYYEKNCGQVPFSVQNVICNDLGWKLAHEKIPYGVLSKEEEKEYLLLARQILEKIEDRIILHQRFCSKELKLSMLKYKGRDAFKVDDEGIYLKEEKIYGFAKDTKLSYDFISINKDTGILEGRLFLPCEMKAKIVFEGRECDLVLFRNEGCVIDEKMTYVYRFKDIFDLKDETLLRAKLNVNGHVSELTKIEMGKYMPLSSIYKKMYACKSGYLIFQKEDGICIQKAGSLQRFIREISYLKELLQTKDADKDNENAAKKAVLVRPLVFLKRMLKRRPIWIFRDRVNLADDNALVLFRYVKRNGIDDVKSVFALSKDSKDLDKVSKIGECIDCLSYQYKLLFLSSDLVISSAADDDVYNPFEGHYEPYKDLLSDVRFIFLQHGVIHNDLSSWLNRFNVDMDGFVCSAHREADALRGKEYGYEKETIWLTGMPRYDELKDEREKIITFAPTWREYLVKTRDRNGVYASSSLFEESEYFKKIDSLLNDKKLKEEADKYGYRLQFILHPSMIVYKDLFKDCCFELAEDVSYNEVFKKSSLFITDYSSAAFDFAYLKKPVLYYQFDQKDFFEGHLWKKGYFDYEKDAFGEIETDHDGIVKRLIEYMEDSCTMKKEYREKADVFFAYSDHKNCERVLEKLRDLQG